MGAHWSDDPRLLFGSFLTKVASHWMRLLYPFSSFGHDVSIHHTCDIRRAAARRIRIGDRVYIAEGTWLNIPEPDRDETPAIILGDGCKIGRRCMISAKNRVYLEEDVMLGPSVLITDHSHEFSNPLLPIHAQGLTPGGTVRVERNCWFGKGAAVVASSGELVVGQNSVVGVNSVVTRSVPKFCVVAGNPAKVIRRYDPVSAKWLRQNSAPEEPVNTSAGTGIG
jgi:acetyltransferase-like isoleucine patch superfamily enzyme